MSSLIRCSCNFPAVVNFKYVGFLHLKCFQAAMSNLLMWKNQVEEKKCSVPKNKSEMEKIVVITEVIKDQLIFIYKYGHLYIQKIKFENVILNWWEYPEKRLNILILLSLLLSHK